MESIAVQTVERRERLERERRGHEAFARTRRRAYVENRNILEVLDRYVDAIGDEVPNDKPLVITGEAGTGKSALLAHWSARLVIDRPSITVITHFVGAGTFGSELPAMLRHLMLELVDLFDLPEEPVEDPAGLADQFLAWMPYLRSRNVLFVVDALNQIGHSPSTDNLLSWVPPQLPSNIRIVMTTLAGEILDGMRQREWGELRVEPLGEEERREVARRFIGGERSFAKVGMNFVRQIAGDSRSANPLFLRTSLEELRLLHMKGDQDLSTATYLGAADLPSLFERVLERIEGEFGKRLVSTLFRMIDASRNGLTNEELADLCGVRVSRVDRLLGMLDYQLVCRDGLYTFFHEHLRHAVQRRYAATNQSRKGALRRLAGYFRGLPVGERRAAEEPGAWLDAGRIDDLAEALGNRELLDYLWRNGRRYEVLGFWKEVREQRDVDIAEFYLSRLQDDEESETTSVLLYDTLGQLAIDLGDYPGAERLLKLGTNAAEVSSHADAERRSLQLNLGVTLREQAKWADAESLLGELLEEAESALGPDDPMVGRIIDALATVFYLRADYQAALDLFERAYEILRRNLGGDHPDTIYCELNIVASHQGLKNYPLIEEMYPRLIRRSERALGREHLHTAALLHNYAMAKEDVEEFPEMKELLDRSLSIVSKLFGPNHLRTTADRVGLASAYLHLGQPERTKEEFKRVIEVKSQILGREHPEVSSVLNRLATHYSREGNYLRSSEICREVLGHRLESFGQDHSHTHRARLNLGNTLLELREFEQALEYFSDSAPEMAGRFGPDNRWSHIWMGRYVRVLRALERTEEANAIEAEWDSHSASKVV